ncbi:APC family permease [Desulfosporosinus lacus]|uniref:Amino acid/polyamine/organocation transporter, APC superfamily (TC 2.A.3) n=1 Tax=Desulfosporosinus lacus DSM 15449 TaxID=1121420 RepID=A0A1M6A598_9FIRM|nr:APC family permease [Desulfosporosinus lacus]SHI31607.1 amino acid/polyamine/organocation transporter, APC superfamily (TC 2.A.3) [Desulfosporosinus lacus DSM 15449]
MPHSGYQEELKRSLTLGDLLIYGIIFMVPIAPFGIFGYVASSSKGMVPLVYLIGMTGMLFTALSYARLAEVFPVAGSVYSYAQRGINEHIGFVAGWLILLDYILIPPLLYLVSATALHTMIPFLPRAAWVIVFVFINTVINILGIEITAKANKVIVALEIIVLLIFLLVGITAVYVHINAAHFSLKPFINREEFNLPLLMSAASIAVLSFLGFDSISTLTEEVKGDRTVAGKLVGKAIILTIPIIGSLFILQTWVASLIVSDYTSFQDLSGAFYEVAQIAGGDWLRGLSSVATALAWGIANALVAQAAISRILFSMARDHKLPAILALIHPKYKTPYISTILVALITLVIIMAGIGIDDLASLINFGALSAFLILHITVINHFIIRKKSRDYLNHLLLPVIGLLIIGYVWMSLGFLAKELGFVWISIGLVYMIGMKLLGKEGFKSEEY